MPGTGNSPASIPVAALSPRIATVGPDTLQAGDVLVVEGEHFGADAPVRVMVAGVELPLRARSATRLEAALPLGAFPCTAAAPQAVQVTVGGTAYSTTRVLRPAVRVALEAGQSMSLLEPGQSRCVELAPAANGSSARYVVAVVNASTTPGDVASFELRGLGDGTGTAGAEAAPAGASPAGLAVMPAAGPQPLAIPASAVLAARRELASLPAVEAAHGAMLQRQLQRVRTGGSAVAAWQRASLAATPALSRAVSGSGVAMASRSTRVGDTLTLMATHASCTAGRAVRARVVYVGSQALVLEDVAAPRAGSMDQQYRQLGGEFDSVVYPLLTKNIGDPLAMNAQLGGDGRVTMLFTRYVNDSLPGTAAYVNACNFYPRSTFAASNQDEVFYARVAGAWETPEEWRRAIRATVVHEAKHLASFAERLSRGVEFEEPWLEEATARIAEELYARTFPGGGAWKGNVGFASSVGCELLQCDDRPLIMWKHFSVLHQYLRGADTLSPLAPSSSNDNTYYASGWALVRWMTDRYARDEGSALRSLVRGGVGTGASALATLHGVSVAEMVSGWATANAIAAVSTGGAPADQSWNTTDQWAGLSALFPGVFERAPLRLQVMTSESAFTGTVGALSSSYHFVNVLSAHTAAFELRAGANAPSLRLAISRVD